MIICKNIPLLLTINTVSLRLFESFKSSLRIYFWLRSLGHVAIYSKVCWELVFPACLLIVGGRTSRLHRLVLSSLMQFCQRSKVRPCHLSQRWCNTRVPFLGIAAIVEPCVDEGVSDIVLGHRGANWLGIGFAAAAFFGPFSLFMITASTGQRMPTRRSGAMSAQSKKLLQQDEMLERGSGSLTRVIMSHFRSCYTLHDLMLFLDDDWHTSQQQHMFLYYVSS